MLEAAVWAQLDTLVALASRVRGNRHVLPFGLLQLRPGAIDPHAVLWGTGGSDGSRQPPGNSADGASEDMPEVAAGNSSSCSSSVDSSSAATTETGNQEGQQQQRWQEDLQQEQAHPSLQGMTGAGTGTEHSGQATSSSTENSNSSSSSRGSGSTAEQQLLASSKYAFAASGGSEAITTALHWRTSPHSAADCLCCTSLAFSYQQHVSKLPCRRSLT